MIDVAVVLVVAVSLSATFHSSEAKVFGRCELAQQLLKNKLPRSQIGTWVCIARYESAYDTSRFNPDSGGHGLFQISQLYWCTSGDKPGRECKQTCAKFRDGNLSDDVACIRKIYDERQRRSGNGFDAWIVYKRQCAGDNSHYVQGCF